jgi:hypothetical protein
MPDQYGRVTSLLDTMGLPEEWHVVEPVPGDLRNIVWIQNAVKGLDGYFEFSPADSDDLDDEQVKNAFMTLLRTPQTNVFAADSCDRTVIEV